MSTENTMGTVFVAIVMVISFCLGVIMTDNMWRADAIKHNAAHYDATTAKFTWNEPEVGGGE